MEEFNLLFNEILNFIDGNELKIEPSSLARFVILPNDKKIEFCLKEYTTNSIQNNIDEASLYKTLYNYYSVLEKGNISYKKSNL